jgi:tripartite-type tricarboxylate transporter receptor subunit TctC
MRTLLAALSFFLVQSAAGQDYPAREIHALCNYGPGSGADVIVRFYSDRLSRLAGKPVIVENRVGANGLIATDALAKSRPDGYTLLITPAASTIAAAPYVFKHLPFDTAKDFQAVTTLATVQFVLLVDAARPIHSIPELVAHLKQRPGEGFYGAQSNSGVISAEIFKAKAGLKTTYTPYKANAQALTDLLQGNVDFLAYDATWAAGQAKGGKVRILASAAAQRSNTLPAVPTLDELGYGGGDVSPWWGVVVPAGTPRAIVDKLAGWFNTITNAEDTKQFLFNQAFDPLPGSPDEMQALLKTAAVRWKSYAELAKITPQ